MSKYSEISKRIGFTNTKQPIPTVEAAQQLLDGVKQGNIDCFEEVFKCYRFCPSPASILEVQAMLFINEAFGYGSENLNWK